MLLDCVSLFSSWLNSHEKIIYILLHRDIFSVALLCKNPEIRSLNLNHRMLKLRSWFVQFLWMERLSCLQHWKVHIPFLSSGCRKDVLGCTLFHLFSCHWFQLIRWQRLSFSSFYGHNIPSQLLQSLSLISFRIKDKLPVVWIVRCISKMLELLLNGWESIELHIQTQILLITKPSEKMFRVIEFLPIRLLDNFRQPLIRKLFLHPEVPYYFYYSYRIKPVIL